MRTTLIGILTLAAAAYAQPERGRGGPGGIPSPPARLLGAEAAMAGRVVKNAPFSADIVTETAQALPDGNRIKQTNTAHFYRDSEGRTRMENLLQHSAGGLPNLPRVVFINDPVARTNYALDPGRRTATRTSWASRSRDGDEPADRSRPMARMGAGAVAPPPDGARRGEMRSRAGQDVKTESLGRQIVEGVQADGARTTTTFAAGEIGNELPVQVVSETWYSPELQTFVLRKRSDPRFGETITRYTNISRTEPARILFEPPADYKTVEPRGFRGRQ
jgi:hypothetical protein